MAAGSGVAGRQVPRGQGAGLFWIIPILDNVAAIIDTRLRTTQFIAERTLTKDTVPVDVDAIIFWTVIDAKRSALEVVNYGEAIAWAAQTSLREMIGAADLAMLLLNSQGDGPGAAQYDPCQGSRLGDRRQIGRDPRCQKPGRALQDAMSRQAPRPSASARLASSWHGRGARSRYSFRSGADLRREPGRAPSARHEHALRKRQGARQHDHRAEQRRRQHEPRRHRRPLPRWLKAAPAGAPDSKSNTPKLPPVRGRRPLPPTS